MLRHAPDTSASLACRAPATAAAALARSATTAVVTSGEKRAGRESARLRKDWM